MSQEKKSIDNIFASTPKKMKISSAVLLLVLFSSVSFVLGTRMNEVKGIVQTVATGGQDFKGVVNLDSTQEVYQALKKRYVGTIDESKLADGASAGLVAAAGDQYTRFFTAKAAKEFKDSLNGSFSGVGIEIGTRRGQPTVLRPLDDSPAMKAGMKKNDVIVSVDGDSVRGADIDMVASKIRGETGTSVKLSIVRNGEQKEFTITRASIRDASVAWRVEGNVGVIQMRRFDDQTYSLAANAVSELKKQNVKGIVVDLRDNGGGLLDQAQKVAGMWVESDKTITVQKGKGTDKKNLKAQGGVEFSGMKTVILVNENSASASEIVAGAVKDYKLAKLIGKKTYGKGSVQELVPLSDGRQLKVTIAKWYTPNGVNISEKGIDVDIVSEMTREDVEANRDPQLQRAMSELR